MCEPRMRVYVWEGRVIKRTEVKKSECQSKCLMTNVFVQLKQFIIYEMEQDKIVNSGSFLVFKNSFAFTFVS